MYTKLPFNLVMNNQWLLHLLQAIREDTFFCKVLIFACLLIVFALGVLVYRWEEITDSLEQRWGDNWDWGTYGKYILVLGIFGFVGLTLSLVAAPLPPLPPPPPQSIIEKIKQFYENGQCESVFSTAEIALKESKQKDSIRYFIAACQFKQMDCQAGYATFQQMYNDDLRENILTISDFCLLRKGKQYINRGDLHKANDCLENALTHELEKKDSIYYLLANSYYQLASSTSSTTEANDYFFKACNYLKENDGTELDGKLKEFRGLLHHCDFNL